ncbi:MAG: hypothetical protein U0X39_16345 [Bacteroidales bacterium]
MIDKKSFVLHLLGNDEIINVLVDCLVVGVPVLVNSLSGVILPRISVMTIASGVESIRCSRKAFS